MASYDIIKEQLHGLEQTEEKNLLEYIQRHINVIFTCNKNDVIEVINGKDVIRLKEVRNELLEGVELLFEGYASNNAINRTVPQKICEDIYHLGYSLVTKEPCKDLRKVYRDGTTPTTVTGNVTLAVAEDADTTGVLTDPATDSGTSTSTSTPNVTSPSSSVAPDIDVGVGTKAKVYAPAECARNYDTALVYLKLMRMKDDLSTLMQGYSDLKASHTDMCLDFQLLKIKLEDLEALHALQGVSTTVAHLSTATPTEAVVTTASAPVGPLPINSSGEPTAVTTTVGQVLPSTAAPAAVGPLPPTVQMTTATHTTNASSAPLTTSTAGLPPAPAPILTAEQGSVDAPGNASGLAAAQAHMAAPGSAPGSAPGLTTAQELVTAPGSAPGLPTAPGSASSLTAGHGLVAAHAAAPTYDFYIGNVSDIYNCNHLMNVINGVVRNKSLIRIEEKKSQIEKWYQGFQGLSTIYQPSGCLCCFNNFCPGPRS